MTIRKLITSNRFGNLLALIAGAITTLAFAPFDIAPLAILTPTVLLALWLNATPKTALYRGFAFGLGLFGTGANWIYISIHTFGDVPIFISAFITAGFVAILALFPAACGYYLTRFYKQNTPYKLLCAFPAFWVLVDWIRSWIFTGFPWLYLGYSQVNTPLRGYASIFSVYGVTLAILLCSALLVLIYQQIQQKRLLHACSSFLFIVLIWLVGAAFSAISWTKPLATPLKVSLVQGNIPQAIKWAPGALQLSLNTYQQLSAPHWDSQLVIWPEAAIPAPYQAVEGFIQEMHDTAAAHHADFISGVPIQVPNTDNYYNAVIMLGADSGYYLKRQLVPFGEYVPLHRVLHHLLDILQVPMSDFIPAHQQTVPLLAHNVHIAVFICYEIAFPELVLLSDDGINMLLTVSNDAWFGHSIAQAQHLQIGQMRALEMQLPVLFVSNNGITAILTPEGQIQSSVPPFQAVVLTDNVQPMQGKTPWHSFGMTPILSLILLMLFGAAVPSWRAYFLKKFR